MISILKYQLNKSISSSSHEQTLYSETKLVSLQCIIFEKKSILCYLFSQKLEKYTPQRSGLRERKRAESPKLTEPSVTEKWMPEESMELWEIKMFGEK